MASESRANRLGVFGGTFDPVHYGHLIMAEVIRDALALDKVLFVPAAIAPHKQGMTSSEPRQRLEMLELAVGGSPALEVSPIEIQRGGVSFTVETLRELKGLHPTSELYLLLGADSLEDLPRWREPKFILELATPVVARRRGSREPDLTLLASLAPPERLADFQRYKVDVPLIELSSSELRRRIASGKSIRFQTPRAVEAYIEAHQLYRQTG